MNALCERLVSVGCVVACASLTAYAVATPSWISGDTAAPEKPAPVLVKEFALDAKPAKAVLTVAVAGWCEVMINGEKVGRDVLSPVTCQPDRRNSSLDFDLTDKLKVGGNTLEVLLGNGWQNTFTICAWGFQNAPWIGCPRIRGELKCDGKILFVTDGSWLAYDSPIVFNSLRNGEWYDARMDALQKCRFWRNFAFFLFVYQKKVVPLRRFLSAHEYIRIYTCEGKKREE